MQRFNTFTLIHKALRAMMYDTSLTIQQTYFADETEAEYALGKIEQVLHQFEQHAHHEDTYVLHAIAAFAPEVVEAFEKEHEEDHRLGRLLEHLVAIFRSIETAEEKIVCGSALAKAFKDFLVFNLNHMEKEEVEVNRVLWKNFTDKQIQEINNRVVANIPLAEKAISAKWIMRGVNKAEATTWLRGVKETAPSLVFQSLYDLTNTELPSHMRFEVQDAVMESELVG